MTFRYAPEPAPATPKNSNGWGLAALIVGVVALIGAVIPLVNFVTGFVAVVGVVLGIVGLVRKNRPRGMALGGLIVSVIALILSVLLVIVYTVGFASLLSGAVRDAESRASSTPSATASPGLAEGATVTYELSGTVPAITASWTDRVGEEFSIQQADAQTLPFTREVVLPGDTDADERLTLAGVGAEDGDLRCRILVDGDVVIEQTASGPAARVACVATAAQVRAAD